MVIPPVETSQDAAKTLDFLLVETASPPLDVPIEKDDVVVKAFDSPDLLYIRPNLLGQARACCLNVAVNATSSAQSAQQACGTQAWPAAG